MGKMQIVALILTSPVWIPAGLLMLYFALIFAAIGGLMGLIAYGFGWKDY